MTTDPSNIQDVAFVLPAYNEEKDLPALLARIEETMKDRPFRYHVVVVDDGSKDRTAEIALEAAERMPLRLIKHEVNRGLGGAMQTGLTAAMRGADFVATMDSDNSHDPMYVADMVDYLNQNPTCDVVIASRYQKGSVVKGVPFIRQLMSYGCFFMLKLLVPFKNVRDYSTGFRCYRSSILEATNAQFNGTLIKENGFVCQLEVLLKMRSLRAEAAEIPYTLRYDLKVGVSKLRIWRTVKRYFAVLTRHHRKLPASARTSTAVKGHMANA
jgi:dolichol-phosphate mannosyltransferase